jgi:hypothetical protein
MGPTTQDETQFHFDSLIKILRTTRSLLAYYCPDLDEARSLRVQTWPF